MVAVQVPKRCLIMKDEFDLIVIGGGSAGIATARRAAEYGAHVALLEKGELGGTCVNVGCVPKKVMWNASRLGEILGDAPDYGFNIDHPTFDWGSLKKRRDAYISRLNSIYQKNLESSQVDIFRGRASFESPDTIRVGSRLIRGKHILIATGGTPNIPKVLGADLGITSDGFFALRQQPKTVLIVGAGYIATEFSGVLHALGSKVTMLVRKNTLLNDFDILLQDKIIDEMCKTGIKIIFNNNISSLRMDSPNQLHATCDGESYGPFDTVVWAIGRNPAASDLNLEATGVKTDADGHVLTDPYQNTSIGGIYAVGDVTGRRNLTPVAIAAGRKLADRLFGGQPTAKLDYHNIPSVVFSHPPIGTVGLTEHEAVSRFGIERITIYQSRFTNIYYGPLERKSPTFVKLIAVGTDEKLVGCHVIGDSADELIQGFAVAIQMGACKVDFDNTVAIHPTAAEELVTLRNGQKSSLPRE